MEKENNFLNCHLNWSNTDAPLIPFSYVLSEQLQHCLPPHFDSSLVARLEGFGNSVNVPLQPQQWSSTTNTACFSPPSLNSPTKLHLSISGSENQGTQVSHFSSGDLGLLTQATRMSCFSQGMSNYGPQFPLSETGRLPRGLAPLGAVVSNNDVPARSSAGEDGELRLIRPESSVSDHTVNESNGRKRKSIKVGDEGNDANAKRSRAMEAANNEKDDPKPKTEPEGANEDGKEEGAKAPEAPKQDYIHVRARRGQATDAHSLAERVRREKISERMKFLQNLVPGCNKVTGKAVMLDEIINYVQSLQRQVEFLSMKLANVNPRLDISVQSLLQKDMNQPGGPLLHPVYPTMESSSSGFPFSHQLPQGVSLQSLTSNAIESLCSRNPSDPMLMKRPLGVQAPILDEFNDATSQVGFLWGDDLHRIVQMGSGQNQEDTKIKL